MKTFARIGGFCLAMTAVTAIAQDLPNIEVQASPYASIPFDQNTGEKIVPESLEPGISADGYPLLRFLMAEGGLKNNITRLLNTYGWEPRWHDTLPDCMDWKVAGHYVVQGMSLQDIVSASLTGYPLRSVLHIPNRVVEIVPTQHINNDCQE